VSTVAVRYKAGVVGEARRQTHLAPVPEDGVPVYWHTLCGLDIPAELTEVSDGPDGMPCLVCLGSTSAFTPSTLDPGPL
jgi:hypothetical protein